MLQAESRLNLLAIDLLEMFDIGGHRPRRVLFPMWKKIDPAGVGQDVFGDVLSVGLVSVEHRAFGQVQFKTAKMLCITVASGRKRHLDRNAFGRGDRMDFQAVEKPAFTALVSLGGVLCGRFWINAAPVDSDVVVDLDRAAINQKDRFTARRLTHLVEPFEKRLQERGQQVEPPVEAASTEPVAEVGRPGEQVRSRLAVASEKASSHNGGSHHLVVITSASGTVRCGLSLWRRARSQTPKGQ